MSEYGDLMAGRDALSWQPGGDNERRRLLLRATELLGAIGIAGAAVPFVESFEPSEKARAEGAPVDATWNDLAVGQLRTVAWRGRPVWLLRRDASMIAALREPNAQLVDPESKRSEQPANCRNATRSATPELLVAVGVCTHLGCTPQLRLDDPKLESELHGVGGFFCPCHGSRFDLAGRVVRNVPAPTNLTIPPYTLGPAGRVHIG